MTQRTKRKTSPLAHSLWLCSWWDFSSHCHADWGTWSWSFLCLRAGCKSCSRQGGSSPPGSPSAGVAVAWGWRWMASFAWGWLVHGSRSSSHSCLLSGSHTHGRSRRSSWSARGQNVRRRSQILGEQGRRWEGCCFLVQCLGNKRMEGNSAQSLTRWFARRSSCALSLSLSPFLSSLCILMPIRELQWAKASGVEGLFPGMNNQCWAPIHIQSQPAETAPTHTEWL